MKKYPPGFPLDLKHTPPCVHFDREDYNVDDSRMLPQTSKNKTIALEFLQKFAWLCTTMLSSAHINEAQLILQQNSTKNNVIVGPPPMHEGSQLPQQSSTIGCNFIRSRYINQAPMQATYWTQQVRQHSQPWPNHLLWHALSSLIHHPPLLQLNVPKPYSYY
jgi:hypothetical protein